MLIDFSFSGFKVDRVASICGSSDFMGISEISLHWLMCRGACAIKASTMFERVIDTVALYHLSMVMFDCLESSTMCTWIVINFWIRHHTISISRTVIAAGSELIFERTLNIWRNQLLCKSQNVVAVNYKHVDVTQPPNHSDYWFSRSQLFQSSTTPLKTKTFSLADWTRSFWTEVKKN